MERTTTAIFECNLEFAKKILSITKLPATVIWYDAKMEAVMANGSGIEITRLTYYILGIAVTLGNIEPVSVVDQD